jgi:hypothetical protein
MDTINPPKAVNGIHHHLPAHQPVSVPPKKKPLAVPVIHIKIRASTPATEPIIGASIRSLRYHGFSNGSMAESCHMQSLSCFIESTYG